MSSAEAPFLPLAEPLFEGNEWAYLKQCMDNQAGMRLFIDTPSTNPFNNSEMSDLGRFIAVADVDPVLVLSAGINAQDAADMAAAFSKLGCRTLIASQLDGARRLGAILAAAQGGNLAFSLVSITPSIANGLTPVNPMSLARVLLRDPEESHANPKTGASRA
jgi:flagellar biosynthesis protein FlhF